MTTQHPVLIKGETYTTVQLAQMGLLPPFVGSPAQQRAYAELGFPYSTVTKIDHEDRTVTFNSEIECN